VSSDRFAGIFGRIRHPVGQWPIDERQQRGRDLAAAHRVPDERPRRGGIGPGGRRQDLAACGLWQPDVAGRSTMAGFLPGSAAAAYTCHMDDVILPPELERFAEEAIAAGRYRDLSELVAAGVSLLQC
jgi:putative addiction module CopG family antidote